MLVQLVAAAAGMCIIVKVKRIPVVKLSSNPASANTGTHTHKQTQIEAVADAHTNIVIICWM